MKLLENTVRRIYIASNGRLWDWLLEQGEIELPRAVGPPRAESADAPYESGLVGQSAVTVSD